MSTLFSASNFWPFIVQSVVLFPSRDAKTGSTGENITLLIGAVNWLSTHTHSQSFSLFHARIVLSSEPVNATAPSGENFTTLTAPLCPESSLTSPPGTNSPAPGRILYMRAVLSREAEARNFPSFENAQKSTASWCNSVKENDLISGTESPERAGGWSSGC